ncbi:interleukin-27 receptor subunit alpha [Hyla sarda]|uniref:interleukin-27 receptor subunit alpha n=1 Tax=Hyla sarda TaxID=327740 RepID=UPI0024C34AEA|nr:interleukin-27 receptor subunit alpha [Hyla sarda]
MFDRLWVQTFLRGLLVLNLHYIHGLFHDCSVCCVIQDKIRDLNCSWKSDVRTEHFVSLQSLTNPEEHPLHFTIDRNWLVIPRKELVVDHKYHLIVTGGGKNYTHYFTYSDDGHNIFIRPPSLNSSILDCYSLEVNWNHPEEDLHIPVELRYRILGAQNWTEVDESDLETSRYVLEDPVPYTQYEFQIRYLPDGTNNKGSIWSDSHVLTSSEMAPNGSVDVWRSLQNGSSLLIMWKPLDHRSARGNILGYQVTYGAEEMTTEEPCCSKMLPAQSTPVCVRARNSEGLGPPMCVTPLCTDEDIFDCKVWGDLKGRISVLCEDNLRAEKVLSYIIEWRDLREGGETGVQWTRRRTVNETFVLPGNFTSGVPYFISVYVLYNNSCARTFSMDLYSREEVPSAAPNFFSHTLSDGTVNVSWEEIPIKHKRGIITHHTIYINSRGRSEHQKVSNKNGSTILSGLSSGTTYTIWMTASTRAGEGPRRIHQIPGNRHRALLIVAVVIHLLFVCVVLMCFCEWPKIPKPENKFKEFFMGSSTNIWQPQQVSLNLVIEVVEEIEPPPKPPTPPPLPSPQTLLPPTPQPSTLLNTDPDITSGYKKCPTLLNKAPVITSGYEKHFMPTPEEIMCLR